MDAEMIKRLRTQEAELDELRENLQTAERKRDGLEKQLMEARQQLAGVRQEAERIRQQPVKMAQIEEQFAQVKRMFAESQDKLQRELVNHWAVIVSPHMTRTREDVEKLTEHQEHLKRSLSEMLTNFEALTEDTAANIVRLFTEQVNGGWAVVAEKHEQAKADLKKLNAHNADKLKKQQETVDKLQETAGKLLKEVSSYDEHFVDLYNSALELNEKSTQVVVNLEAAVTKLDGLTNGALKEMAEGAKQSISETREAAISEMNETSETAISEMNKARTRAVRVLTGFENRLVDHPVLATLAAAATVCLVMLMGGLWVGKEAVIGNAQEITRQANQESLDRLAPAIEKLNGLAEGLNVKVEQAELWNQLTEGMTPEQKQAYIKQAQQQAARRGRTLKVSEQAGR